MRTLILVIPLALLAPSGMGQESEFRPEELQPIDSRVADVSVLSTSLRSVAPGLGPPSGFDLVYRVPGTDDLLMRANGALYAVFDQSVYKTIEGYPITEVPPSTVFHIGRPNLVSAPLRQRESEGDNSVSNDPGLIPGATRAGYGFVLPAGPQTGNRISYAVPEGTVLTLPRFVSDRKYRSKRLQEILNRRLSSQAGR